MVLRRFSALLFSFAALSWAGASFAQLNLRGDYASARGITEVGALYARQHRTTVNVRPFSTNAGIDGVLKGEIDIAAAARPPIASRAGESELVFWPVAWDAVVFIVHPSNPVRQLSVQQVRDIFLGNLDNWKEVGGRDAPIDLYSVMGPYDGLESSIRQILFGNPGYMAKIDRLFLNQHQIEVGVQMDPDSIGMTTLAGLDKQRVRALDIEGVAATKDTVADGRYLLTIPLYLVYRADSPKAAEITRFAEFLRTPVAEAVMVNKRLVPHRDNEDFRTLHTQRLARLWERMGGEPVAQATLARASTSSESPAAVAPPAEAAAPAPGATPAVTATGAAVAAAAPAAEATGPAVATPPAGPVMTAADGSVEEPACKRRLFSRKC